MDRKTISVILAGVVVVLGLIASALGVAGITNMTAARLFLVTAGVVAVITVCTAEAFALRSIKVVMVWGAITALISGPVLFGVDRWMINKKNRQETAAEKPQGPVDIGGQIARSRHAPVEYEGEPIQRMIRTDQGMSAECSNPPTHAILNYWPLTFTSPAEFCHDYPLIDARKADDAGQYSKSKEDLIAGVTAHNGDELYILIYLNNGAANRGEDRSVTVARNVSITTKTDLLRGTTHYIDVTVAGDNIESIYGKVRINTNANEKLDILPKTGQVRNSTATSILSDGFDMGNGVLRVGDIRPNWEDSLFFRYAVKVSL